MTVHRFAVSFDEKLARAVREAAGDQPISTWLAEAAERRLRSEGLAAVVREWEAAHGELTATDVRRGAAALRGRRRARER